VWVQQVLTIKEKKLLGRNLKGKKRGGIRTSNTILKRHNNNYLFKNLKKVLLFATNLQNDVMMLASE
jgi:hypothetical protein